MRASAPPTTTAAPRRRYLPHLGFFIYCAITLLVAIGAFQGQNNLLFWLFGLSLGLMIVSGFISGSMLMGVHVQREPVGEVHAGQPLVVRYTVANRNRFVPVFALTISELLPEKHRLAPGAPLSAQDAPGGRLDGPPEGFCAHVAPGASVTVEAVALATRRGEVPLIGFQVTTQFPFGIIRKLLQFDVPGAAIVRPALVEVDRALLRAAMGGATTSDSLSRRRGPGDEFLALREYVPGDSVRQIAWKPSARADALLVRQTASASPRRLWIILDLEGAPKADVARREAAVSLAASIIIQATGAGLLVGLSVPEDNVHAPARAGRWHVGALLNDLALLGDPLHHRPAPPSGAGGPAVPAGPGAPLPPNRTSAALSRAMSDTCLVLHAGPLRREIGPAHAVHHAVARPDAAAPLPAGAAA